MKIRIPMDELRGGRKRNKGFGFVTFYDEAAVVKALDEREVTVDVCSIEIEKAMKRVMPQRDNP